MTRIMAGLLFILLGALNAHYSSAQSADTAEALKEINPSRLNLLEGDALYSAFAGRTMDGTYKRVRERSGTARFTETFSSSGATLYKEGTTVEAGRWQLMGPPGFETIICFQYTGSMEGPASCFTVFKAGTCLYSYNPNFIRAGKPIEANHWSAKTVIRGDLSSCNDFMS